MGEAARARARLRPPGARGNVSSTKRMRADHFSLPLIVGAGIIAYHNSLDTPFVLDDIPAISWNQTIRTIWPLWPVLSPPPTTAVSGRPIVNLSLALNYALTGSDSVSYHVFNLGVHLLSALVLFAVVLRTLRSPGLRAWYGERGVGIATSVALLWVVHPLTTDSVAYTIQRTELLMGLFFLLTLYCAIRSFESPRDRRWQLAALAAFAFGLGSKEVIAVAPVVVFAWDWLFWSKSLREPLRQHRGLYAGLGVVLVLFVMFIGTRLRQAFTGIADVISPWHYALTQSGVIVRYLGLAIWPHSLTADYGGWPIATSLTSVLPYVTIVLALLALVSWGLVRKKKLAFLGVWFFVILAPTSSFRPLTNEVAAERRMYLPLAAIVLLAVLGGSNLLRRLRAPRISGRLVVLALAAVLAFFTVRRNHVFRTPIVFWSDVVSKRPDNPRARISLGYYLYKQGRHADALTHLARAVRLEPENASARYSFGVVLASQGKTTEAVEQYREAIRINPQDVRTRFNLARALVQQGHRDESIEHLEAAIRLRPDFSAARRLLAQLRSGASR